MGMSFLSFLTGSSTVGVGVAGTAPEMGAPETATGAGGGGA